MKTFKILALASLFSASLQAGNNTGIGLGRQVDVMFVASDDLRKVELRLGHSDNTTIPNNPGFLAKKDGASIYAENLDDTELFLLKSRDQLDDGK